MWKQETKGWQAMAENLVWLDATREQTVESAEEKTTIFLHDDDITPTNYMILELQRTFGLSDELAEHITWVARTTGIACVSTRPRNEAKGLVNKVHAAARCAGFPLTFSLEEETGEPQQESRKNVLPFALSVFLLLIFAVSVAVADGAANVAF
jgi:ATP-dependent Clp protease adapter protein ClpS